MKKTYITPKTDIVPSYPLQVLSGSGPGAGSQKDPGMIRRYGGGIYDEWEEDDEDFEEHSPFNVQRSKLL